MGELLETLKKQNSSELITKWETIGFLSNAKNKKNLALACEFSALYLLDNVEKYNGEITTLAHPVIIRIFREIEQDLPSELIFDKVVQIIKAFYGVLNRVKEKDEWVNRENYERDIELMEIIVGFCEEYYDISNQ